VEAAILNTPPTNSCFLADATNISPSETIVTHAEIAILVLPRFLTHIHGSSFPQAERRGPGFRIVCRVSANSGFSAAFLLKIRHWTKRI